MTGSRSTQNGDVRVHRGRRVTRRAFLQSAAVVGVAAVGLQGAGSAIASRGPAPPDAAPNQQAARDPIADLADALLYDVDAIYRFVADDIRYEPYAGVLRGARGTLDARAGNAADQALLLAALLDAALIPVRFAVGSIDGSVAERLLDGAQADADTVSRSTFEALAGELPGLPAPALPALEADAQTVIDTAAAAQDQIVAWARAEVQRTMSSIESALQDAGTQLPREFSTVPELETGRHTWVQALQGPDWVDLDPSLAGGPRGEALTSAVETLDELPEDLYHWVDLVVTGETATEDRIETDTLLSLSARADRLAGLPITFVNASPTGVERLGELITPVAGTLSYVPTIAIGEEAFAGRPIRFGRGEGTDLGEGLLGGADDFLGGAAAQGETSAEWLELIVSSPGREPVVARRAVFDRFGPAARAAGMLDPATMAEAAEVDLDTGAGPDILPALSTTWLAVDVGLPARDAPVLAQAEASVGELAAFAHGLHMMRGVSDLALGVPLGVRSFVDAPNVAAYTIGPAEHQTGEQMVELGFDIWHRSRGVAPVDGASAAPAPATVAGVLGHVAERLLAGDALEHTAGDDRVPMVSVGAVLDAAGQDGVSLRIVATKDDVAELAYPPDAAATLRASLRDGWIAVAPERSVILGGEDRAGWWLIDTVHGRAVDQLDNGRGASIEYQATLTPGQLARETALKKLARDCLSGSAIALAAIVAGFCGGFAYASDSAGAALACGAASGALGVAGASPLGSCIGAAIAVRSSATSPAVV